MAEPVGEFVFGQLPGGEGEHGDYEFGVASGQALAIQHEEPFAASTPSGSIFVLIDGKCQARHALEYQGDSHHQGSTAARDAVEKEALRKAGIGYHAAVAGHTTAGELRALVEKLVVGKSSG